MTNRAVSSRQLSSRHILRAILAALIFASAGTFILVYQFRPTDEINLERGDVAPRDILAPNQIIYDSEIETETARERARNSIPTIYSRPNPKVARQQVERLRKIFEFLETIRADPHGSMAQKFEWIDAIPDLTLSDTVIDQILIMTDQDWTDTRQQALAILSDAMSTEIREIQVRVTRRQLPTKVSLDTPDEQSNVIVSVTEDLIRPNTFPDEERTEAERQAAAEAVDLVVVTVEPNELIIPAGQVVGPRQLEALEALGLQKPKFSLTEGFIAPTILVLLTTIIVSAHLFQYTPKILADGKRLVLLIFLVLIFITVAKFMIPAGSIIAYLYPMAALAMMLVILIDAQLAFIVTTILALLAGYITTDETRNIVIYLILSGWAGALALGLGRRVNTLIWGGMYVAIVNTGVILIFHLTSLESDITQVGILLLEGILNGIFSAGLAFFGLFAIGNIFGITTSIQLLDLERPTQPLLRQLLLKAPGTYHHSLMVSNLGQQAAERIGADSLLVRVMALYHDIGKMQRPYFFIENQPDGMATVHEKLDPQVSAQIIINHMTDGLDLAQKYRLPQAIKDGIAQHHGTDLVKFFYYQATEAAKETGLQIDEAKFHYPGPRPRTKENGILMLADISESTIRALKPSSAAEIDEIVRKSIAHRLENGQLDECDLTISDLNKIRTAFVDILQGVHHPRIKYPDQIKAESPESAQPQAENPAIQAPAESTDKTSPKVAPQPLKIASTNPSSRPARLVQRE
jgi:putative nucleotidyltransferase with HDIG domain